MAYTLGLLLLGGFWVAPVSSRGAEPDFTLIDTDTEDLPDMNFVKSQAEAGRPRSQTQLADFYLTLADYTNAVTWYQKAAAQDHVPAQLSLAGCLLSGRGVDRNPAAAAGWLRRAADAIERATRSTNTPPVLSSAPTPATRPTAAPPTTATNSVVGLPAVAPTNAAAARRIQSLLAAQPDLQEPPTELRSPADTR